MQYFTWNPAWAFTVLAGAVKITQKTEADKNRCTLVIDYFIWQHVNVQQSFMQFCNSILFCKPPKEFFICNFFLFWSGSMQSTKSSTPRILWKSRESWASFVIRSLSALQLNQFQPPKHSKCALGDTEKLRLYICVQWNQCIQIIRWFPVYHDTMVYVQLNNAKKSSAFATPAMFSRDFKLLQESWLIWVVDEIVFKASQFVTFVSSFTKLLKIFLDNLYFVHLMWAGQRCILGHCCTILALFECTGCFFTGLP